MNSPPVFAAGHAIRTPINQVLRNTYMLLALTLVAGAIAAYVAMSSNAGRVNWFLYLGFAIAMPYVIHATRNSVWGIVTSFIYAAGLGYIAGPIISMYSRTLGIHIPIYAFTATATIFLGLTGYAMATKRDFSFMRGFMFAGGLAVLLAIVANMFLHIPLLSVTISTVGVLLCSAGILYSTSAAINGGEDNYIVLASDIYGSLWALFMNLMNILGFFSGD
jgi:modulator of FtsH protease